jgi:hypothetical protein
MMHFVTAVWGREYVQLFLDITLPSILADNNLPAAKSHFNCRYKIYTAVDDFNVIKYAEVIKVLHEHAQVELIPITDFSGNKYEVASRCYRKATSDALQDRAAIIYLIPDMILADGSLGYIAEQLSSGKKAVLVAGMRASKESAVPVLIENYKRDETISITSKALVGLMMRHIHPLMRHHMWDEDRQGGFHPSFFCWQVTECGFYVHCAHLQPVAVDFSEQTRHLAFQGTIDDDLLAALDPQSDEIDVVTDSDKVVWFELSSRDHTFGLPTRRELWGVVSWLRAATSPKNRELLRLAIKIHSDDLQSPEWQKIGNRGSFVVNTILNAYELSEDNDPCAQSAPVTAAVSSQDILTLEASAKTSLAVAQDYLQSGPLMDSVKLVAKSFERRARGVLSAPGRSGSSIRTIGAMLILGLVKFARTTKNTWHGIFGSNDSGRAA